MTTENRERTRRKRLAIEAKEKSYQLIRLALLNERIDVDVALRLYMVVSNERSAAGQGMVSSIVVATLEREAKKRPH